MRKIDVRAVLCALALCFQIKSSEQSMPICNVTVSVHGSPDWTPLSPKYNDDGVLEVEAGQGISILIESKSVPLISFSPNLEIHTRQDVTYTDINDSTTYVARFDVYVQVGENQSGWIDYWCNIEERRNSTTIFFTSDKSGKKLVESGSTIQLKETASSYVVPCPATNKNVLPTLRLVSPANLKNDDVTADYEPTMGFWSPVVDDSISTTKTFECVVDEEKVTVEFPEKDDDFYNRPTIWMNESSKIPECSVKRSTDITIETISCDDLFHCRQLMPYYYQPLPNPGLKVDKCTNCTDIPVPMTADPMEKPLQTMTIRCYASGMPEQRDVVRGLDGVYYFGDRLWRTPEVTIRAKEISRKGSKVTVGVKALRYHYFPVKDASISFKDGSTEIIDQKSMSRSFDQGAHNLEVTVNVNENMDKITFHAFQLTTMKLTNVSVSVASPGYLLRGTQQEN